MEVRGPVVRLVDAVIIGMGYVGLPLAREASAAGLSLIGLDTSPEVVDGLNSGRSHVDDQQGAVLRFHDPSIALWRFARVGWEPGAVVGGGLGWVSQNCAGTEVGIRRWL